MDMEEDVEKDAHEEENEKTKGAAEQEQSDKAVRGRKVREIVLPGELVGEGLKAGTGTYREGKKVYAAQVGIKNIRAGYVNVIPINGKYIPRVGDQVIGYITDVGPTYWMVDINSPYPAPLHINDVPWKVDFGDTMRYLKVGDTVLVTVSSVDEMKHVQVSMMTQGHRRLNTGSIVEVTPTKVPRIIGKGGSMISMIKRMTRCRIIVGQNGRIWIDGERESMLLAAEAIEIIEREGHAYGLTERIKLFLEKHGRRDETGIEGKETEREKKEEAGG